MSAKKVSRCCIVIESIFLHLSRDDQLRISASCRLWYEKIVGSVINAVPARPNAVFILGRHLLLLEQKNAGRRRHYVEQCQLAFFLIQVLLEDEIPVKVIGEPRHPAIVLHRSNPLLTVRVYFSEPMRLITHGKLSVRKEWIVAPEKEHFHRLSRQLSKPRQISYVIG